MYEDERLNQNVSNRTENYEGGSLGGYNSYESNANGGAYNNSGYTRSYGAYGDNQNSTYGGNQQTNTYGYGNTTYSYNNGGQQTYGTYQYSTGNATGTVNAPAKKSNVVAKVIAAVAILALVVGGVGASYYVINNQSALMGIGESSKQEEALEEPQQQASAKTVEQTETQDKIQSTTVSAETKAVVTDVTAVVSEVMPAMVIIHNNYTQSASFFGYTQTQEATASGSGVIVGQNDSELLVATNYHVIEGADTLEVIFNDETTVQAYVKGTNSDMDLAVIAVMKEDLSSETMDQIKIATLGDSDALILGEPAIAIGNALGYGQSVTTGVISALDRTIELEDGSTRAFIQTDAAINPGNSGGALLNLQGEVIGINSNKLGGTTVEGMGYAIPISAAKPIIEELMNEETKIRYSDDERGYVGIKGVTVTSDVSQVYGLPIGVYIAEASVGGGAANAGLTKGDVIVGFEGNEITSMDDLQTRLQYYPQGATVQITVMRQNGAEYVEQTFDVTLGGKAELNGSADSNAGEDNSDHYDGQQQPGKAEDRNNGNGRGH